MSEQPDPRVEIMASVVADTAADQSPWSDPWDDLTERGQDNARRSLRAALAAMESAGWRIVKLEQVGEFIESDDESNPLPLYRIRTEGDKP